jgi:prepilin signal peptidase PulO-like enzyme (type II secretory pathway)
VFSFWLLASRGQLTTPLLVYHFFLLSVLIVVAVVDLKFYLIPTSLVFLASFIGLFYNYFFLPSNIFVEHVISAFAAALFFLVIVVATRGRGMGEGDIVLGFLFGMVLGYTGTVISIFLAFLIGAIVSVFLLAAGKKHFGQTVPFAPFLVLGFLLVLFFESEIFSWYLMIY